MVHQKLNTILFEIPPVVRKLLKNKNRLPIFTLICCLQMVLKTFLGFNARLRLCNNYNQPKSWNSMKGNARIGNRKWGTICAPATWKKCDEKHLLDARKPKGYSETPGNGWRRQCTSKWIMWPYPRGWLHTGFNEMLCSGHKEKWLPPQDSGGKQWAVVHFVKACTRDCEQLLQEFQWYPNPTGIVITCSKQWVNPAHKKRQQYSLWRRGCN